MKIKIGFDLSPIAYRGGVATYTKELAARLDRDESVEMKFFYSSLRQKPALKLKNIKRFYLPARIYEPLMNNFRFIDVSKLVGQVDVYHSSDWVQISSKAKKVTTVHDVIPFKYPEWSVGKVVDVHKKRMQSVIAEVDKIICVSNTTKADLMQLFGIDEKRIKVIYEGVDDKYKTLPKTLVEEFRRRNGLPQKFLLAIGGVGDRRNLGRVVEAGKILNIPVVTTGRDINVNDDEMPLLYNAASVLVYPSFYEGFGLPILEAFQSGIPVVTSDLGAMKEIADGAAILVDPQSVESIKKGIEKSFDAKFANEFIKKGLLRAKYFSWDKCCTETVELYKELV